MTLPKILIVEDDEAYQDQAEMALKDLATVLRAETQQEAAKIFQENPDVKAIIMDGYVPGPEDESTLDLIQSIRNAGYTGPMVASSSSEKMQWLQKQAGCSHDSVSKSRAAFLVQHWLKNPAKMAEAWVQSGKMMLSQFGRGSSNADPTSSPSS